MSDTPDARPPRRFDLPYRLAALVGVPLTVLLIFRLSAPVPVGPQGLAERSAEWSRAFAEMLVEARAVAGATLDGSVAPATAPPNRIVSRLEGRGILDETGRYLEWDGSPAEPTAEFFDAGTPDWRVRVDPVRTRLDVRAGPDPEGRRALATFVLESAVERLRFEELLPARLRTGIQASVSFNDSAAGGPGPRGGPDDSTAVLAPPGEPPLGVATLSALDETQRRRRYNAAARATAVLALLALAALLFAWRRRVAAGPGLAAALASIAAARFALLKLDVPAALFSQELGGATVFGSAAAFGLIGSPIDLLFTGLTLYLFALAVREYLRSLAPRHPGRARAAAAGAAVALTAAGVALCGPLARDARMSLLDRQALFEGDARSILLVGLVLALLGAAESWGLAAALVRRRSEPVRPRRLAVAVPLILLCAICGGAIQRLDQDLALERLRSEFAPLVLEQSPRRELALAEAVRHVYDAYQDPGHSIHRPGRRADHLAYDFWVDSALFTTGYKSSLDFFNSNGARISHFAFDLPAFEEQPKVAPEDTGELWTGEEEFEPVPALEQEIFHAEVAVFRRGEFLGTVVGHVLDEADNLPFLPHSRPYLAALGAGRRNSDRGGSVDSWEDPQYVLYTDRGTIRQSTLLRPPPLSAALREAGRSHEVVEVESGGDRYVGLALADHGRLHLLLVPARGVFEQAAAAVRLALLGMALLALLALGPALLARNGLRPLRLALSRSFHAKLLAAMLVASILPLFGIGLILRGAVERRAAAALNDSATQTVNVAQRVLEDYFALQSENDAPQDLHDDILHWLRGVVGQEIHVFDDGVLQASSKRELFTVGLLPLRIDGEVHRELIGGGRPSLVRTTTLGPTSVPVAYAPVRTSDPDLNLIAAVPIVLEQRQIARTLDRLVQVALLATVALVALVAASAAFLARTVARPVKELAAATSKISAGDYDTRLMPSTRDEIGELVLGFNSMATALARQRADLERRREYMERLLRHATTGVMSTDAAGRIVTLNPAARTLLGAVADALRPGASLTGALSTSPMLRPLARALDEPRSGKSEPHDVDLERDDEPRRFRFVRIELPEPGGETGTLILIDDVTELMRSNQLAAWAEMARAIAHEIKNPLTPIQLSTEHLRRLLADRRVLPSPEIEACIETVIKQVRSLHQIAGEFSTYAKLPVLKTERSDAVALMRSVIGPYRAAHPPGISIRLDFEEAGRIAVDRRVVSRALINLIENALQAMPDGGTLTVGVRPLSGGDEVELSVTDTGIGLDAEVRRRLFEPYFSTKSAGTGLGLAIVQRAVEAHHGRIELDSEPGAGTSIRVVLPAAREGVATDRDRIG